MAIPVSKQCWQCNHHDVWIQIQNGTHQKIHLPSWDRTSANSGIKEPVPQSRFHRHRLKIRFWIPGCSSNLCIFIHAYIPESLESAGTESHKRTHWIRTGMSRSLQKSSFVSLVEFMHLSILSVFRMHLSILFSKEHLSILSGFQKALVNLVSIPKSTCQSCQSSKMHLSILSVFQNALVNLVWIPKTLVNLVSFMHVHVSLPELWAPANQRWQVPSRDKIRGETHSHPESRLSPS